MQDEENTENEGELGENNEGETGQTKKGKWGRTHARNASAREAVVESGGQSGGAAEPLYCRMHGVIPAERVVVNVQGNKRCPICMQFVSAGPPPVKEDPVNLRPRFRQKVRNRSNRY